MLINYRIYVVLLSLMTFSGALHGKSLSELSAGFPQLPLPQEQFITVTAYKLRHPELLYLNIKLLQEMGFTISDPPTAAEKQQVLDALAWVTKDNWIQSNEIIPSEVRSFYVDYYGGSGIGRNNGSARALSGGIVQIRGAGVNPMASWFRRWSGRTDLYGSLQNVAWGEVTRRELPHGGNRIVAVISRGVRDGKGQLLTMDVRIAPVRPAQFIPPTRARRFDEDNFALSDYGSKPIARAKLAAMKLTSALPLPTRFDRTKMTDAEIIVEGVREYSARTAAQFATMTVKRMLHGAPTESNAEMSGKLLDFATSSTQPGYQMIYSLEHFYFGNISSVRERSIRRWSFFIERLVPDGLRGQVLQVLSRESASSLSEMAVKTFDESYAAAEGRAILWTLGVPETWMSLLIQEYKETLLDSFSSILESAIKHSESVDLEKIESLNDSNGFFANLTKELYRSADWSGPKVDSAVARAGISSRGLAKTLVPFMQSLKTLAAKENWSGENLRTYLKVTSEFRNRPIEDLYAPKMKALTAQLNGQKTLALEQVNAQIENIVTRSVRSTPRLAAHQAPIRVAQRVDANGEKSLQVEALNVLTGDHQWINLDPAQCEKRLGMTQD